MAKDNKFIVEFKKSYVFEGKNYDRIDLSEIENLKAEDFYKINKRFSTENYVSTKPEVDPRFCTMIASQAAHLPEEFFDNLPIKELIKIRNTVSDFFLEEE